MDSQERKQAMLHLLRNVVNFEDESIAEKGLERSNALDVGSFMALTSDSIKEMQYRDAQAGRSARNLPIGAGNANALYQLQCFLRFVSMKLNNQLAELNDFTQVWTNLLQPLLFWKGDTMDIISQSTTKTSKKDEPT